MQWDGRNNALRCALDFPAGTLIGEHAAKVDALRLGYQHTVVLRQASEDLTCVPYALELTTNPTYRAIAADFNREVFAGSEFIEWLLNDRLCEVRYNTASAGTVLLRQNLAACRFRDLSGSDHIQMGYIPSL